MKRQSTRSKYKNIYPNPASDIVRSVKTVIYNDIFTPLRCKKVQSPAKQFKELFSLCPNHFR